MDWINPRDSAVVSNIESNGIAAGILVEKFIGHGVFEDVNWVAFLDYTSSKVRFRALANVYWDFVVLEETERILEIFPTKIWNNDSWCGPWLTGSSYVRVRWRFHILIFSSFRVPLTPVRKSNLATSNERYSGCSITWPGTRKRNILGRFLVTSNIWCSGKSLHIRAGCNKVFEAMSRAWRGGGGVRRAGERNGKCRREMDSNYMR